MTRAALVIVDVQEDFLPPHGSLAVSGGREIIPGIASLISEPRWACVAASLDWHPENHSLFASHHQMAPFSHLRFTHPAGATDSSGAVLSQELTLWPVHCVQDTPGAQLEPLVEKAVGHVQVPSRLILKGTLPDREYYLAFGDIWSLHKTDLEHFLRLRGVSAVVFVGIAYDYCVFNSARDCASLGFDTYVLKDLCRAVDALLDEATDARYRDAGVTVCTGSDLDNLGLSSDA